MEEAKLKAILDTKYPRWANQPIAFMTDLFHTARGVDDVAVIEVLIVKLGVEGRLRENPAYRQAFEDLYARGPVFEGLRSQANEQLINDQFVFYKLPVSKFTTTFILELLYDDYPNCTKPSVFCQRLSINQKLRDELRARAAEQKRIVEEGRATSLTLQQAALDAEFIVSARLGSDADQYLVQEEHRKLRNWLPAQLAAERSKIEEARRMRTLAKTPEGRKQLRSEVQKAVAAEPSATKKPALPPQPAIDSRFKPLDLDEFSGVALYRVPENAVLIRTLAQHDEFAHIKAGTDLPLSQFLFSLLGRPEQERLMRTFSADSLSWAFKVYAITKVRPRTVTI